MSSEEANARALLLEMQARLANGPHAALGVPMHATPADIRGAFLQLTKTFHPARFGRMANDIQRLSNEVFLALRAAHDQLAKPKSQPTRGNSTTAAPATKAVTRPFGVPITPATRPGIPSTGRMPAEPRAATFDPPTQPPRAATFDPPTQPPQRKTGPIATARPGPTPAPMVRQPSSSSSSPPNRPMSRTPTPVGGVPVRSTSVGGVPPARPTPVGGVPPVRPTPPSASGKTPAPQLTRASQPAGVIRFPPTAPVTPPRPTGAQVAQARPPGSSSSGQSLDRELAPILELMGMGMWDAAQAAIDALVAKQPQNKRYEALACYARGRRAQLEHRYDDARVELGRALMLDPELEPAKIANAELFAQRRR